MRSRAFDPHLLVDFLHDDAIARMDFSRKAYPYLLGRARRRSPELPEDLWPEVVQEAFKELGRIAREAPGAFDPQRGTTEAFLEGVLGTAVRETRKAYRRPGQRTRYWRKVHRGSAGGAGTQLAEAEVTARPAPVRYAQIEEQLGAAPASAMEAVCEVHRLLDRAPAPARAGLVGVHLEGRRQVEVAAELGVHRLKLHRAVRAYLEEVRGVA